LIFAFGQWERLARVRFGVLVPPRQPFAPKGGLKRYYVELDACDPPPVESLKISYDYLKALTV
jgi:hypothetical protein